MPWPVRDPQWAVVDGQKKCGGCLELLDVEAEFAPAHRVDFKRKCRRCEHRRYDDDRDTKVLDARRRHLSNKYGITLEEYDRKLQEQNGICMICGKPETSRHRGKVRELAVDHDHEDGQNRDLLCVRCNRIVAIFEHAPLELTQSVLQYLAKWKGRK